MPTNKGKQYTNHTIVLPFDEETYPKTSKNAALFREQILKLAAEHPRLFPEEIKNGFRMKDIYRSVRLDILIRRIEIDGTAYTVRPSFVLPYLSGRTEDAEHALFRRPELVEGLRKFDVPFWALKHVFSRSAMHWCRLEQTIGRYSIVETTVQNPEDIPKHVAADDTSTGSVQESIPGLRVLKRTLVLSLSKHCDNLRFWLHPRRIGSGKSRRGFIDSELWCIQSRSHGA